MEKTLQFVGFQLGDFVKVSNGATQKYSESKPKNLITREDNNFGYVDNVLCKLHKIDDMMVFTSGLFGSSLCSDDSLAEGSYHVTISWLESPVTVSDGTVLYSVGTNALPNQKQQQFQKSTVPQQQPPNQSPKPFQAPSPAIRRFYQPPPSESSINLPDIGFYFEDTEGSIAGESVESNEHRGRRSETFKFLWAARRSVDQGTTFLDCVGLKSGAFLFRRSKVHNVFSTLRMNGNHFIFSNALTAPALCREPLSPGRYSVRISFESTFFFHDQLKRRGCFQGEFEEVGNGNWECRRYQKRIDPFVTTGFDSQNNIWLQVGITKYERQNDTRFPHAEAEHVGRIVDIDYKLSFDCKGKQVKVQRQKVWDDHSEWVVTEVLRASEAQ